jgi:hypothetical protein
MHRKSRQLLIPFSRAVAAALILSVAAAGMPAAAQEARHPAAAPSALRQSIDRAVETAAAEAAVNAPHESARAAALTADEQADLSRRTRRLKANPVAGQASGGGAGRIILAVLGLAVSVGTTYYYIQYMKKQQEKEQEQAGFRP